MKKLFAIILSAAILLNAGILCASADDAITVDPVVDAVPAAMDDLSPATADEPAATPDQASVCVTIADADGKTVVAAEMLDVTDTDADGALTVNDVLYAAHEAFYDGGAAAGYETSVTQYGLGIQKLWGSANGGSYGYYVNNASAWSLSDAVRDGDYVAAFVYTDLVGWSDHYSSFDQLFVSATRDEAITLTYSEAGYDESWNPVSLPVEGAVITVDGAETAFVTDSNGSVTLSVSDGGVHLISAAAAGKTLVAPVCKITVTVAGDVNMDGKVDNRDAVILDRFVAGWDGYDAYVADNNAADLSGEGKIDNRDAVILDRYIAGWDGYQDYIK